MEDAVVDGLSDRGSTPLRSIKERSDRALALSDLSFVYLKSVGTCMIRKLCFRTGAHDVQWTSVLGRPERSGDRLSGGERLGPTEPAGETARGPVDRRYCADRSEAETDSPQSHFFMLPMSMTIYGRRYANVSFEKG